MSIEVNTTRFQPLNTGTVGNTSFNANGKIQAETTEVVKRVEEAVVVAKVETEAKQVEEPVLSMGQDIKDSIQKMLDEINSSMYGYNKELHFSINQNTKDLIVQVVNGKTGEILQQYPAEEIVEMRESLLDGKTTGLTLESSAS